ncbi:MAG TPA: pyridoxamine 5'-phosphate oxidase family protein [Steroidobacteraceae bacterium]|nr:pyridoxamine 5'-phosphate oxidase family protein [Steroidobacteraceae bacterium]
MNEPLINDELAAFISSGLSITLASRNADNMPSAARAKGCVLVHGTSCKLRVFVSASQARQVVTDVRANGAISATFSVPDTHRSMQFKGCDAHVAELQSGDRALIDQYIDIFARRVAGNGFSPAFVHAFFASPPDEIAVEFTPTDAFQQTPGPNAGTRL